MAENTAGDFRRVFDSTVAFFDGLKNETELLPTVLHAMRDGKATVELKKKYALRAIDETWVNIIEDTLPALDVIIRNPAKYIEEREEILPIELTRRVSARSLQHLSQHTDMIANIEGDKITPSKLLNVFREETMLTYENRFVNTLIDRLYIFVNRRYQIALKEGSDEKTTTLSYQQEFRHGEVRGRMRFEVEISEAEKNDVERSYTQTTDLWHRVQKLNSVVGTFAASDFCQKMGKTFIHPPVMHTNAIMKNKNLHQCLLLWQFIESYDNAGLSMLVQEDLEKVDEEYLDQLYQNLALQYVVFRHKIKNEFEAEDTLDSRATDDVLTPRLIDELTGEVSEDEYAVTDEVERRVPMPAKTRQGALLTPEDRMILEALDIALKAADIFALDEEPVPEAPIPEPEAPVIPPLVELPGAEETAGETEETKETEKAEEAEPERPKTPRRDASTKRAYQRHTRRKRFREAGKGKNNGS